MQPCSASVVSGKAKSIGSIFSSAALFRKYEMMSRKRRVKARAAGNLDKQAAELRSISTSNRRLGGNTSVIVSCRDFNSDFVLC